MADGGGPPVLGRAGREIRGHSGFSGIGLIVLYKLAKAVAELSLVAAFLLVGPGRLAEHARAVAAFVRHHAASAWSAALAERLTGAATERHARVVTLALLLDGVFTCIEGWVLHRRYPWGRWLVIAATSCLLPFEVVALARHHSAGRASLLVLNLLIVAYLVRRKHDFEEG